MTSRGAMWCSPQRDAIAGLRDRPALQPHHRQWRPAPVHSDLKMLGWASFRASTFSRPSGGRKRCLGA